MQDPHDGFKDQLVELLPRLWRFGYSLTRSKDVSEDLVQATCERALTRRHQWQPGSRLDRWVFSIMHSIWKNDLRARRVRVGNGEVDPETALSDDGSHTMEVRLRTQEVAKAIETLPEEQQSALFLVYVEGHSYREAADILEIPLGTVMSRLSRARLSLADRVERPAKGVGHTFQVAPG
ncbi:MAG: RNA polymerase sigma factor [Pseudomonadota bacterium]